MVTLHHHRSECGIELAVIILIPDRNELCIQRLSQFLWVIVLPIVEACLVLEHAVTIWSADCGEALDFLPDCIRYALSNRSIRRNAHAFRVGAGAPRPHP